MLGVTALHSAVPSSCLIQVKAWEEIPNLAEAVTMSIWLSESTRCVRWKLALVLQFSEGTGISECGPWWHQRWAQSTFWQQCCVPFSSCWTPAGEEAVKFWHETFTVVWLEKCCYPLWAKPWIYIHVQATGTHVQCHFPTGEGGA